MIYVSIYVNEIFTKRAEVAYIFETLQRFVLRHDTHSTAGVLQTVHILVEKENRRFHKCLESHPPPY